LLPAKVTGGNSLENDDLGIIKGKFISPILNHIYQSEYTLILIEEVMARSSL